MHFVHVYNFLPILAWAVYGLSVVVGNRFEQIMCAMQQTGKIGKFPEMKNEQYKRNLLQPHSQTPHRTHTPREIQIYWLMWPILLNSLGPNWSLSVTNIFAVFERRKIVFFFDAAEASMRCT